MQIRSCRLNPILWNPALQQKYLHSTYVPDDNTQYDRCWLLSTPIHVSRPSFPLSAVGTIQCSSLLQTTLLGETGAHVLSKLCDSFGKSPKSHLTWETSQCHWGFVTEPNFWWCPARPHLHGRVGAQMSLGIPHSPQHLRPAASISPI